MQTILAGFMKDRHTPCSNGYLEFGGFAGPETIPPDWSSIASQIIVKLSPKGAGNAATPPIAPIPLKSGTGKRLVVAAGSTTISGPSAFQSGLHFNDIPSLVDSLRAWLGGIGAHAVQLDGLSGSNPRKWITFDVDVFAPGQIQVPRYNKASRFIDWHAQDGVSFNGKYKFHGDAKVDAIRDFITHYDSGAPLVDLFCPALTEKGNLKLNRAGTVGAAGFYCYRC